MVIKFVFFRKEIKKLEFWQMFGKAQQMNNESYVYWTLHHCDR